VSTIWDTVLQWVSDNFKILAVALAAGIVYAQNNATALGLSGQQVAVLGLVLVVLVATDPNRDHVDPAPAPSPQPPAQGLSVSLEPIDDQTPVG
jgi:hypothetical protein